jgi:hypothetical protein
MEIWAPESDVELWFARRTIPPPRGTLHTLELGSAVNSVSACMQWRVLTSGEHNAAMFVGFCNVESQYCSTNRGER